MANIVKYNNDMNTVQFNKFKDKELDLFFSICYKMKEKGENKIILGFSELKELSNYSSTSLLRFEKDLNSTYKKLLALNFKIVKSEGEYTLFNLFSDYTVNMNDKIITIALNEKYSYILNELGTTYTKFELEQFTNLKSVYSKNLFKLLKQWESVKEKTFELEEFRRVLNIPKSYDFSKINIKILKVILEELPKYFSNFKLEKIRVGRKIQRLKFSWAAKDMKQAKLIEIEIVISEKLNKTIEKTRKNKFINPILTKENIKHLLEIFDENILINAFNKAYKEITKDINLNYLKTYIENSLKQQQIKFTVTKDLEDIETIEEKKEELKTEIREPKEKRKVSEEEKNRKYKEYLENNDLEDNKFNKKSFEVIFNNDFELEETEMNEDNKKEEKDYAEMEKYKREFETNNPELMEKYKVKAKEKEKIWEDRSNYLKKLKAIELELIMNNDDRLEKFKINFMQFFRLHDYIMEELKYVSEQDIESANIKLEKLQDYFKMFEKKKEQILEFENIPPEKLLSKNGKKIFGGALASRLKKIAKEMKTKIKYKNKIIG